MELVERESTEGQGAAMGASTWGRQKGTRSTTMGPEAGPQLAAIQQTQVAWPRRPGWETGRVGETGDGWSGSARSQVSTNRPLVQVRRPHPSPHPCPHQLSLGDSSP